jgi:hypothetical protein
MLRVMLYAMRVLGSGCRGRALGGFNFLLEFLDALAESLVLGLVVRDHVGQGAAGAGWV